MGTTIAILQARMGSTRLPGKVLLPLAGAPLLQRLIERLRWSRRLDRLIVATTDLAADDAIARLCETLGVACFRGSEDDVLSRFLTVARDAGADVVVRLTGDNPFVDGGLVDEILTRFQSASPPLDYCNNVDGSGYPYGLSVEIVRRAALEAANASDDPADREHVTRFVRTGGDFRVMVMTAPHPFAYDRLTIDTPKDYQQAKALFERLYTIRPDFPYTDLLRESAISAASITIAGRTIGAGNSPYIIAEVGINHGGSLDMARRMIVEAAATGADAVKLQTFQSGKFLAKDCGYFDILKDAELSTEAIAELMDLAATNGITLFSAVFDEGSADLLDRLGAPAFKIASGDLTHLPLLRHVARMGKPMILSTGAATLPEVEEAVAAIRAVAPATPLAVLHCVSNYPTAPAQANLACLATLRNALGCPIGYSDHTLGNAVPLAAVAVGAEIIEKHFTLDRTLPGPDHQLSSDPQGFRELVEGALAVWQAIGRPEKAPVEDAAMIGAIRRSVTTHVAIAAGSVITPGMVEVKRPGTGIAPKDIDRVIGARVRRDLPADKTLGWDDLEPAS